MVQLLVKERTWFAMDHAGEAVSGKMTKNSNKKIKSSSAAHFVH